MQASTPILTKWKSTDTIRNLRTGKLYMVLHVIKGYATILSSLSDPQELPPTFTLYTRDYYKYEKDCNVEEKNGAWRAQGAII